MDFIPFLYEWVGWLLVGGGTAGFALLIYGLIFSQVRWLVIPGAALLLSFVLVLVFVPAPRYGWEREVRADINETYGLKLSERQFEKLHYPDQAHEPEGNFKQYGSVTVVRPDGDSFKKTEVYLLWSKGKMVLAAPDEQKNLQPLKIQN